MSSRNCLKPFEVIPMYVFSRSLAFHKIDGVFSTEKFGVALAASVVNAMLNKRVPEIFQESSGDEFRSLSRALIYHCIALWFADAVKRKLPESECWVVHANLLRALEGRNVWDTGAMLAAQGILGTKLKADDVFAEITSSPEYDVFEKTVLRFIESLFISDFMSPRPLSLEELFSANHEIIHSEFSSLEWYTHSIQSLALDVCNLVKKNLRENADAHRKFYTKFMVENVPQSHWSN